MREVLEGLEDRAVPAAVSWVGPQSGGVWDVTSYWSTGKLPTAADDVTIKLNSPGTVQITRAGDAANSITTDGNSALQVNIGGTLAIGNGTTALGGGLQIVAGAAVTVNAGATVGIDTKPVILAGSLSIGANSTVTFTGGSTTNPNGIQDSGLLNVVSSKLISSGGYSPLDVYSNGRMIATNSTFSMTTQGYDYGGILQAGDLVGNTFVTSFGLDPLQVKYVTNNVSFGEVDLYANNPGGLNDGAFTGSFLPSGNNLVLPILGSNPAGMFYRFVDNYEVSAGATLTFGPKVTVAFTYPTSAGLEGSSLIVDANGLVVFNTDNVYLFTNTANGSPVGSILIAGNVQATNTNFITQGYPVSPPPNSAGTRMVVQNGGRLAGTGNNFGASTTSFANGAILTSDGTPTGSPILTGNNFLGTVVDIKGTLIPFITNNLQFGEVDIRSDTLGGPNNDPQSLELTNMGTVSTASLFYVFNGDYTVAAGATLILDPGLRINNYSIHFLNNKFLQSGNTLTINGTLKMGVDGSGQTSTIPTLLSLLTAPPEPTTNPTFFYPTGQIVVGSTGTVQATNTNIVNVPGSYTTQITFAGGSHFSATSSNFAPTFLSLADGAILNSDSTQSTSTVAALTNNYFANTTLSIPTLLLPLIGNNQQFSEIDLLPVPGGLSTNISLLPIGTVTASTLNYYLVGDPVINSGATMTVAPNLIVQADPTSTITVNGALNFGQGDLLTLGNINVTTTGTGATDGTLQLPAATMTLGGLFGGGTLNVGNNGTFITLGSVINASLVFGPNSAESMTLTTLIGTLTVDQSTHAPGSTSSPAIITQNNFTAVGANGIIATGASTTSPTNNPAVIPMPGNYWGTITPAGIDAKILDHKDPGHADLPTINYLPFVNSTSVTIGQDATAVYGSADQTITLNATIAATNGTINEGTVTFAIYNGTQLIGTAVTVPEANGAAKTPYTIPGLTPVGSYTIQVIYNGTNNYLPSIDATRRLTITQASSTVAGPVGGQVSATYSNVAAQTISLPAFVTSTAGQVNEGTVVFTVFTTGTTPVQVGLPVSGVVTNGAATGTFVLPIGTPGGKYTVQVAFAGSQNYSASTASTYTLNVNPAATSVTATDAAATFSTSTQTLTLTGSVTSAAGQINEGTLTFQVVGANGPVGSPVTANVVFDTTTNTSRATATYTLPAGATVGTDTIQVTYTGTNNFASSSTPATANLVIGQASSTITVSPAQLAYNTTDQSVRLTANVASGNSAINEGTVTFGVFDSNGNLVGTLAGGNVVNGVATADYVVPAASLTVGTTYTVQAVFNGSTDYVGSTATPSSLTIVQASTVVGTALSPVTYSPASQQVTLYGGVLANGVGVGEGSVTFSVYAGATLLGTTAPVPLVNGNAYTTFTVPGGTKAGTVLAVAANYSGSGNYLAGSATNSIIIGQATPTVAFASPAPIVYGTPLSSTQLAAVASVPGTFTYSPATNTVLNAGAGQVLVATFAPTDSVDYTGAVASTTITVVQAAPTFSLTTPSQAITRGTPGIILAGQIAAPTAIPAGQTVAIILTSSTQSISAVATINANGTFATTVDTSTLGVGGYTIRYAYAGDANFLPTTADTGFVAVTPTPQVIPAYAVPSSVLFGTSFHINPVSSSGLPVLITGTNAIVTASVGGGYDVAPTSGTLPVILVATQPGNGNFLPAAPTIEAVATVRANASIVIVPNFGIVYDGLPHGVGATTNPPGLATSVTYTLNGVPVAAPTLPGTYAVSGSIIDPNYQGTATSALVIVPAVAPPPNNGGGGTVTTVSVAGVTVTTANRGRSITAINVTFTGTPSGAQLANLGNYRLATAGSKGSFDAKNAKTYRISAANYDPISNTVTVRLLKPQKVGAAYQFRISNIASGTVNATINKKGHISL